MSGLRVGIVSVQQQSHYRKGLGSTFPENHEARVLSAHSVYVDRLDTRLLSFVPASYLLLHLQSISEWCHNRRPSVGGVLGQTLQALEGRYLLQASNPYSD